jgi:hypothetical protein
LLPPTKTHQWALQYVQAKSNEFISYLMTTYPNDVRTKMLVQDGWNKKIMLQKGETTQFTDTGCLLIGLDDVKTNVSVDYLNLKVLAALAIVASGRGGRHHHLFTTTLRWFLLIGIEELRWDIQMNCSFCKQHGVCDHDYCPRCNWQDPPFECAASKETDAQATIVSVKCDYTGSPHYSPLPTIYQGTYRNESAYAYHDSKSPPTLKCSAVETVSTFPPYQENRLTWEVISTPVQLQIGDVFYYDPVACQQGKECTVQLRSRSHGRGEQRFPMQVRMRSCMDASLKSMTCFGLEGNTLKACCDLKKGRNIPDSACRKFLYGSPPEAPPKKPYEWMTLP